jgi:hypothetical protein
MQSSIRCFVTGVNALDAVDSTDRFIVASRLWAEGISAEYMDQSGVINSLIKENREEVHGAGTSVSNGHHSHISLLFHGSNFVSDFRDGPWKTCVGSVLY